MAENSGQESEFPVDAGNQQVTQQMGTLLKWGAAVGGLVVLYSLVSLLKSVYTDLLWFDALDFRGVYTKILFMRVVLFLIGAAIFAVPMSISALYAHRLSRGPVTLPLPEETVDVLRKIIGWGAVATVAVLSLIFGGVLSSRWEIFLRFFNSATFGQKDPVFSRDLSFYVFDLPVYEFVQGWLLGAGVVVLLASLALYVVNYGFRGVSFSLTTGLKVQLSIIGSFLMLTLALGHWLDRWELVLSEQGAVFGAAYVDLHARSPALLVLTVVAAAGGVLALVNAYMRGLRLLVGAVLLWIAMSVLLSAGWPAAMQQLRVNPNEFVKEREYIDRNIEFTRSGFGIEIDDVEELFYPVDTSVPKEAIEQNPQTINNIRLWDYRPLSDVYKQIQLIRPYYDFKDADVDRYTVNGEYRQVLLSAREVAPEKLDENSQTWVNQKLIYTHGIGLAMSPATQFTPEGRPEFYAKDIPNDGRIPVGAPGAEPDIVVDNPRIYYGENTVDYVITNTKTDEVDYNTEEGELIRNNYAGEGGVRLSSIFRRMAYAWEFADINNRRQPAPVPSRGTGADIEGSSLPASRRRPVHRSHRGASDLDSGRLHRLGQVPLLGPYRRLLQLHTQQRQDHDGLLRRRHSLLRVGHVGPHGPDLCGDLPGPVHPQGVDARIPQGARPLSSGPVHDPSPEVHQVPHAGSTGLLQQ